jgi:mannose-6-phosphate isomerase-like protein (cupin superfamily)
MKSPDQIESSINIPPELDGNNLEAYMQGNLDDIDNISDWVSDESLKDKPHRVFSGFEIYDGIDGGVKVDREVSLVLAKSGSYPQHVHKTSDAFFVIVDGQAVFLSGDRKFCASVGNRIKIPKGTPHGFDIGEGDVFSFVSIQNPPIKDHHTGEEDFHLVDLV